MKITCYITAKTSSLKAEMKRYFALVLAFRHVSILGLNLQKHFTQGNMNYFFQEGLFTTLHVHLVSREENLVSRRESCLEKQESRPTFERYYITHSFSIVIIWGAADLYSWDPQIFCIVPHFTYSYYTLYL